MEDTGIKLLTMVETAKLLRCERKSIERWLKEKPDFPRPINIGRKLLWKLSDIEAYIESQRK